LFCFTVTAAYSPGTVTITGSVEEGSTRKILILATRDDVTKVKIDPETDLSGVQNLSIGGRITVVAGLKADSYLHALRITADDITGYACYAVTGTFVTGSPAERVILRVNGFNTEYYVDAAADVPDSSQLLPGKKLTVTYYVGVDNRRHAVKISDASRPFISSGSSDSASQNGNATSDSPPGTPETITVSGKIGSGSKSDLVSIYMEGYPMQIKPDSSCDLSKSKILIPGNNVNAAVYRNDDDGYMHAVSFSANYKLDADVSVDMRDPVTVTGKVSSGSDANVIHLNVDGCIMEIHLDSTTDYSKCRVIEGNKIISASIGYGSDGCLHAISISE